MDHDADEINQVVLPLLNISRRLPDNTINPKEPNQQVVCATSAGVKTSYAYTRLIDDFIRSIISPDTTFVMGCDYRVPLIHGMLEKDYIDQLRTSPSYDEMSFAREYLGIWSGSSDESWFKFDKLVKLRKIKNPERQKKGGLQANQFYILSVDVGRLHDQTVCTVLKITERNNKYHSAIVNIMVLARDSKSKTFENQAIEIKRIIKDFDPLEVVIDTNGLGIGLADEMIKEQIDKNGIKYPPYGFKNDKNYKEVQPTSAPQILYGIKANSTLKPQIHSNVYSRTSSGLVHFLIDEKEAKTTLLATKVGKKMNHMQRTIRLMPHEMTTRLFDEMSNLRLKKLSGNDIVLEQINKHYSDDKYFSFAYGLWRVKELEEANYKVAVRRQEGVRQLVFYSGG